jgi:hypothetical protein
MTRRPAESVNAADDAGPSGMSKAAAADTAATITAGKRTGIFCLNLAGKSGPRL